AFPLRRHSSYPEQEIRRIVQLKLDQVGLPGIADRSPDQLSGGMRKRVAIARALALDPEILILDEPTSGLDPIMADAIDDLICQMKQGRTLLVISHDIANAMTVGDRIGLIDDHQLVCFGPTAEVLQSPDPKVRRFLDRGSRLARRPD
ncbi:MAG: ATP-binding cassette domain-containing protein, partial [Cyanobacteria bacterium REEB65]|nr:ATP-binding cassette domain-containing protein [Cyanobacteria bacterium REEB65]